MNLRKATFSAPKRILLANSWWHEDIVKGIVRNAALRGWHVDLQTILSGRLPNHWDGDGIITMFGCDIEQLERIIDQSDCPVVSLNANYPEIDIPRVTQDDSIVGHLAADHFLERNFINFAYYSHGFSPTTDKIRYSAFDATLRRAGYTAHHIAWEEGHGRQAEDFWQKRQGWLQSKLSLLPKPLAVLAINDQAAAEVIEVCIADGVSVPDQIAVLGVLDMPIFRQSTTIPLSSVTVDHDQSTGMACDLLERMMNGEPTPEKPIMITPSGVAERRSTDTIATNTQEARRAIRFILDHYSEPIGFETLAKAAGVCKTLLYEAFKQDLGKTPGAVLSEVRIDKSKRMLLDTNEKVRAVSESCGFGDPVNLYRQFKKHVGMSPAEYRRSEKTEHRI